MPWKGWEEINEAQEAASFWAGARLLLHHTIIALQSVLPLFPPRVEKANTVAITSKKSTIFICEACTKAAVACLRTPLPHLGPVDALSCARCLHAGQPCTVVLEGGKRVVLSGKHRSHDLDDAFVPGGPYWAAAEEVRGEDWLFVLGCFMVDVKKYLVRKQAELFVAGGAGGTRTRNTNRPTTKASLPVLQTPHNNHPPPLLPPQLPVPHHHLPPPPPNLAARLPTQAGVRPRPRFPEPIAVVGGSSGSQQPGTSQGGGGEREKSKSSSGKLSKEGKAEKRKAKKMLKSGLGKVMDGAVANPSKVVKTSSQSKTKNKLPTDILQHPSVNQPSIHNSANPAILTKNGQDGDPVAAVTGGGIGRMIKLGLGEVTKLMRGRGDLVKECGREGTDGPSASRSSDRIRAAAAEVRVETNIIPLRFRKGYAQPPTHTSRIASPSPSASSTSSDSAGGDEEEPEVDAAKSERSLVSAHRRVMSNGGLTSLKEEERKRIDRACTEIPTYAERFSSPQNSASSSSPTSTPSNSDISSPTVTPSDLLFDEEEWDFLDANKLLLPGQVRPVLA